MDDPPAFPESARGDHRAERAGHRVVIVGGGFGGLYCAKSLRRAPVSVTLVDRRNFHLFQPLLYQVASGWLAPAEIASPLRVVFETAPNVEVLLGEVTDVDLGRREIFLEDGRPIPYDSLVLAIGSSVDYFGRRAWADLAPGLKTIENATEIRRRIFLAYEAAERETDPAARAAWLTFVIVGGGTTGVEMAGVLGELAHDILHGEFRHIDPAESRIVLVQSRDRVLPEFGPKLAGSARRDLERLGVEIRTGTRVEDVDATGVVLRARDGTERLESQTVIWAAGVRPSPLASRLTKLADAELDGAGRFIVRPDLTVPGHPEVFVIGDMAGLTQDGEDLPGVAPVAMEEGRFAASTIRARVEGRPPPARFRYHDRGTLATIGRGSAVAMIGPVQFDGFLAWVVWIFVHLLYLVEFQNRFVVITRWAWDFFRHERGARLITGDPLLPQPRRLEHPVEASSAGHHAPPHEARRFGGAARREKIPTGV